MPLLHRNPDALWTEFDGQVVVLSVSSGHYFETRGVGGAIWQLLASPCTASDIVQHVVDRYQVEPGRGERDVMTFLQSLQRAGLLAERGAVASPAP
jgi:hypothetical protein